MSTAAIPAPSPDAAAPTAPAAAAAVVSRNGGEISVTVTTEFSVVRIGLPVDDAIKLVNDLRAELAALWHALSWLPDDARRMEWISAKVGRAVTREMAVGKEEK